MIAFNMILFSSVRKKLKIKKKNSFYNIKYVDNLLRSKNASNI